MDFELSSIFQAISDGIFLERFSPFILMDYNEPYEFMDTTVRTGVDTHPHRGFETATICYE